MEKISVITVVRNGEQFIRSTMESVINQDQSPHEYVIWDGVSTDRTLEIISEFKSPLVKVFSNKDSGPFDAMNKAVKECTGDWLIFMNCGDEFASRSILGEATELLNSDVDIVYGGCIKSFSFGERIQSPGNLSGLLKSTIFWHQSVFIRRSLQEELPFDCKYRVCADYDFTWKAFRKGARFHRTDLVVSRVSTGGISDVQEFRGILERYHITKRDRYIVATAYVIMHVLKFAMRIVVKKILPVSVVQRIQLARKVSS